MPFALAFRPRRSANPSNLVALALVLVGAGLLARERLGSGAAPTRQCDPAVDEECSANDPSPPGTSMAGAPAPSALPDLDAERVCRRAGYLCAGLRPGQSMRVQHWKNIEGPLVVHIPLPEGEPAYEAQRLQRSAAAGVRLWNGQPYPVMVDERGTREAHIEVRWEGRMGGGRIGLARTQWSQGTGLRVESLTLGTRDPHNGDPVDLRQLRLTAAHEMGHALGLPHSGDSKDVMYPTNTATSLSARDYRTLEVLYSLEDGSQIVMR